MVLNSNFYLKIHSNQKRETIDHRSHNGANKTKTIYIGVMMVKHVDGFRKISNINAK